MIARIVINGWPISEVFGRKEMEVTAENLLLRTFRAWPVRYSAKFLITPGGFLNSKLPVGLSVASGWNSSGGDLPVLQRHAAAVVRRVVTDRVRAASVGKAHSLTIGIDLYNDRHSAELVGLIRFRDGEILRWTGKSYPTAHQERSLIQVVDLRSHCLTFEGERVLILGCHDLNMFSPRGRSNQLRGGKRWTRCKEMRTLVSVFRPTVILQHPHSTDSPRIWAQSWAWLRNEYRRTLNDWASGIGFYGWGGVRGSLDDVLAKTRCGNHSEGFDFVFSTRDGRLTGPDIRPIPNQAK